MRVYQRHTAWQRMTLHLCLLLALGLPCIAAFTPVAQGQAETPVKAADSDPSWRARYWNNKDLAGNPVVERDEGEINYNWGGGSPDGAVNSDKFSARWTRYLYLEAGR